jgi:enolase
LISWRPLSQCLKRKRFESRGNPTVQVTVITEQSIFGSQYLTLVISGASKGDYEAVELRDGGKDFGGKWGLNAVKNVRSKISVWKSKIDELLCRLDGTEDKGRLGANAILGCSMAVARAGAASRVSKLLSS